MKNIVITGGNRGIGLGLLNNLSKDHNVIITSRTEEKGLNAIRSIVQSPKKVDFVIMDVNKSESVIKGFAKIKEKFEHIDVLFNNAGILIPGLKFNISAVDTDEESILKTFNTNTIGVLRVTKQSVLLMKSGARIINISSGMGQLNDMGSGSLAYRLSKTALNALTKVMANELSERNINVNAICPGWVQTDMGGKDANLTINESVSKIISFALGHEFPTGKFLRHGEIIPW